MTRKVVVVPPDLSLAAAWDVMRREDIRHLPVVRAGALVGMLSDRDILTVGTRNKDGHFLVPKNVVVAEAMTPVPLLTCEVSTDVRELVRSMTMQKVDAVPVVRGLHLCGLVTSTDLLLLLLKGTELQALPPLDYELVEERLQA